MSSGLGRNRVDKCLLLHQEVLDLMMQSREGESVETTCDVWATQPMVPRVQIVNSRKHSFHDARGTESMGALVLYSGNPPGLPQATKRPIVIDCQDQWQLAVDLYVAAVRTQSSLIMRTIIKVP